MAELILFYFEDCPYCQKVLCFMEKEGLEITLRDVREDSAARKRLIKEGGKYQVPCLFIDNRPLYESDDIINWFKENHKIVRK